VRQCNRGYFHNVAKSPPHIPDGVIPDDAWATTDYFPGDVLVLNPFTPHASMPNRSNRCRVTLDTRIQSAADPRVIVGDVVGANDNAITVRKGDGSQATFKVDDETMIRIQSPGIPEKRSEYAHRVEVGRAVLVVRDGDRAVMLRRTNDR
jgi:ectoine hydroxylase-related dioxygenase (phytanoyl-CoA dioxygenase family)